jgi:hypothetical protein
LSIFLPADAGCRQKTQSCGVVMSVKVRSGWPHDHHLPVLPSPQSGLTVPCCHWMSLNLWDHEDSFLLLWKRTKECDFRNLSKELLSWRFWSKGKRLLSGGHAADLHLLITAPVTWYRGSVHSEGM